MGIKKGQHRNAPRIKIQYPMKNRCKDNVQKRLLQLNSDK